MNLLLYIILAALLGVGSWGQVERKVEKRLRASLGEVETVEVEIRRQRTSPVSKTIEKIEIGLSGFRLEETPESEGVTFNLGRDTMTGRINHLQVTARDFAIGEMPIKEMGLHVERLRYNFKKLLIRKRLEIVGVDACTGDVVLEADDLERYVGSRVEALEGFELRLADGKVEVSGRVKGLLPVAVPICLTATPKAEIGRIYLRDARLKVTEVPVPGFVAEKILEQINPVVDLNSDIEMPFIFELTKVKVEPTALSAEGKIYFKRASKTVKKAPEKARLAERMEQVAA